MARFLRIEFEDAIYHICGRGNARAQIFKTDFDCEQFLKFLERSAARFSGAVFCFALMGNHFHLLIQTKQPNLSKWMHWLIVSYSVYFNRRHRRSGHLFQGRYKSFLVEDGEYLVGLSRYIHLNPVRGLRLGRGDPCHRRERLHRFQWSSYRGYAGLTRQFAFVEEAMVLDEFGGSSFEGRIKYRRFVEEGLVQEIENPFEAVQWQTALGSESFLRKIRARIRNLPKEKREMTSARQGVEFTRPETMLSRVARKFQVDPKILVSRNGHGLQARNVAMWVISEKCGLSLREIGEFFGGLHYSAVAQRICRTRNKYSAKAAQLLLSEMSNV